MQSGAGSCAAIGVLKPGAIGKPVPGHTVAVIGADGQVLKAGELGQIAVKRPDPVMFLEYWGKPEATRDKFIGDWMTTGDQGIVDEEGYFSFVGRDDDVITSSGFRIGPGEIEDCLLRHPAVALAAVVGKPDADAHRDREGFHRAERRSRAFGRARRRHPDLRQDAALRPRISARGRLHRRHADDDHRQGDPPPAARARLGRPVAENEDVEAEPALGHDVECDRLATMRRRRRRRRALDADTRNEDRRTARD